MTRYNESSRTSAREWTNRARICLAAYPSGATSLYPVGGGTSSRTRGGNDGQAHHTMSGTF